MSQKRKTEECELETPSDQSFSVRREDDSHLICDPEKPLEPGCKVVVVYPAERKGQPRTISGLGTLESTSTKTRIAWVTFPLDDATERRVRIDQSKGYDVIRAVAVTTRLAPPLTWRAPGELTRRVPDNFSLKAPFFFVAGTVANRVEHGLICDPKGPIKYDGRIVLKVTMQGSSDLPARTAYFEGRVTTKHPDTSKTVDVRLNNGFFERRRAKEDIASVVFEVRSSVPKASP